MYLTNSISKWVELTPDAVAVRFENDNITFKKLDAMVNRLRASLFEKFAIKSGDRVAYLGLNHPNMIALLLACEQLGAVFSPFNSRLALEEYQFLLADSKPVVCFHDHQFEELVSKLNGTETRLAPVHSVFEMDNRQDNPRQQASIDEKDPLLLVYTSGTTGRPKGVLLSRKAVQTNIENCNDLYDFQPSDRVQITLPLFHVGGLCILLLPALTHGATIHLHRSFNPQETLREIEDQNITTSIFVPAQMAAMMALPDWMNRDLSSLNYVAVGSSIIPMKQIKEFHSKGIPVSQIYGATETGPAAIGLALQDSMSHEGAAGKPVKHCQIEVRSSDNSVCATGENGEIWVKGSNILSGYWQNRKETQKVLINGWYNTGDIGYRDPAGFYWIVDRAKDMIISGGENIYPAEVEAVSLEHPAIAAIAVVGKQDHHWGETPVAAIELNDGQSLTLSDYHQFLAPKLARYKQPKALMIFDPLPRNGMGKIEKSVLRNEVNSTD